MKDKTQEYAAEVSKILSNAWTAALVTAGINSGIFDMMNTVSPIKIEEIAKFKNFDVEKLKKWFYYLESVKIVENRDEGYVLTPKGLLFTPKSPIKDLAGLVQLNDYFMRASIHSEETFKTNQSLDRLTEGKISRDYQPKVSDNFSMELAKNLKEIKAGVGDTLLDVGCGNGSFLRVLHEQIPSIKYCGIDQNAHAIDLGREQNANKGVDGQIKLTVGDITDKINKIKNNSYHWVTAINIFHFVDKTKRMDVIKNMIRVASKGVLMTQVVVETTPISATADPLMSLLWNDFTGFFKREELEELNNTLVEKHTNCTFSMVPIMHGISNLVTVIKEQP